MTSYSLVHLSDEVLSGDLVRKAFQNCPSTAEQLAYLAEYDARKLYVPAGYPSMSAYCLGELPMCEEAAHKHIRCARAARRFPRLFEAVADGRLHLSAVLLLAPYLTPETEVELIAAAARKSKRQIEGLLAERFPKRDVPTGLAAIPIRPSGPVETPVSPGTPEREVSPGTPHPLSRVTPLSSQSYALQVTLAQKTHDKLRYLQSLLGHQVPSGDLAAVLDWALDAAIARREKQKFAACAHPRPGRGASKPGTRYVPAHVRRTVWHRDGGQCTFVSGAGKRCPARDRLEFDHVEPVARGGTATVGGIRLRCRAHNQYEAERTFGADFMRHKRETARAATREKVLARPDPGPRPTEDDEKDVIPWLRALGYRADQARYAAERCADMPDDASLEERVRVALACLRPRAVTVTPAPRPGAAMAT
jgi:hypothetical protein